MKIFGVVWLLAIALATLPRPAHAEPIRGAFALKSDLNSADVIAVTKAAFGRMLAVGWTASDQLDKKDTQLLIDCLDKEGPCFPKQLQARGVRGAIVYEAKSERTANGDRVVILVGKIVLSDRPEFLVVVRRCESCNDDTLVQTSSSLADALLQQLAVQVGRTLVSVNSNPPGANVIFDSKMIGATPTVVKTFPGKHAVQIQKPGYRPADRSVIASEGTTQDVTVQLDSADGHQGNPATRPVGGPIDVGNDRGKPWGPIAMIAGGGLLVVGGGVLLYVGGRAEGEQLYRYPRATPIGVVSGLAGLGLASAGALLWWRDSKQTSGPTVDATATGAMVGWGGTF